MGVGVGVGVGLEFGVWDVCCQAFALLFFSLFKCGALSNCSLWPLFWYVWCVSAAACVLLCMFAHTF